MAGELDEFRLIRPLGRGGMGEVFLGHDTVLDRPVAIKLITRASDDNRERFLTEARAIARLNHPNVVTIYRVGHASNGQPYIAQELIRGASLDKIARPVDWRTLCAIAIGVARGLHAAHGCGVLHRDVKPANVMLDERGTARLLDFGIAKLSTENPLKDRAGPVAKPPPRRANDIDVTRDPIALSRVTTTAASVEIPRAEPATGDDSVAGSQLIGTPRYAAPELWRGEPATVQTDLFALGVLLYELAAAAPPFRETEMAALADAITNHPPRPLREVAELPAEFAALIMRCVAQTPADRPRSAGELAHGFELILAGAPALPPGNPYRGLAAFGAAHRGLFFGRGLDIRAVVDRLRSEPLVAIVGDSGIGKSSLCHAGVVPEVIAGSLGDPRQWRAVAIVPGRTPWRALTTALAIDGEPEQIARSLASTSERGVLLVIDQLEELVTTSEPSQAAQVARLLAAIADGIPGAKALVTVRGDFLTRIAALPSLGGALTRGIHVLRLLAREDLHEAIVGPARANGVRFESDEMVSELVDAVVAHPGALPLLQFALAALWDARDVTSAAITKAALVQLGGVEGALAAHADAIVRNQPARERAATHRVLLRLVGPERSRVMRVRDELGGDDPVIDRAIEALVRGRLVVARDSGDGNASYELAHEALIRSWGTLRDLLDDERGQHAVRSRLTAAAAEWARLERRADLLWAPRQLAELRPGADPTPVEAAFVAASRQRRRRRVVIRIAAVAVIPIAIAAVIVLLDRAAASARAHTVAERIAAASRSHDLANELARRAVTARRDALAAFTARRDGEPSWRDAREYARQADANFREAELALEGALAVDPAAISVAMAAVLADHAQLAHDTDNRDQRDDIVRRLASYDATASGGWQQMANFELTVAPPAELAIHAVAKNGASTIAGGYDATPIAHAAAASQITRELAAGSYVAVINSDGHVVRDPFVIEPGERVAHHIAVPPRRDGWIYVPAGRFRYGSAADDNFRIQFLMAQPQHERTLPAFWIGRTEVTFADWLTYLRALPPDQAALHEPTLATTQNTVALQRDADGMFELELRPSARSIHHAREGVPIEYSARKRRRTVRWERLPVVGVSYDDGVAYASWLDRTGQLPGARMCTSLEWERAARGADGRAFPAGDNLATDDANFDETYGREPLAFGPDEVGSHPASDSPFGVADLAGNVWEPTTGLDGKPWNKGGSYYQDRATALTTNNAPSESTLRGSRYGLRICSGSTPTP